VGINLAVQDAVAAANVLAEPLRTRHLTNGHLEAVQRRRALPTRLTQDLQVFIQNRIWGRVDRRRDEVLKPPQSVLLFERWPWLRRIPARLIGVGLRPEHVQAD
jgi:2-polyprenyl-6-methoxyphenol hydroxylase-like FAD-dependent oxidoreductase